MPIRTQSNALYSLSVPRSGCQAHTCRFAASTLSRRPKVCSICPQVLHQHTANAVLDVPPTCSQVPAAYSAIQAGCEDHCLGGMASDVHHSLHNQDVGDLSLPDHAQDGRCPAAAKLTSGWGHVPLTERLALSQIISVPSMLPVADRGSTPDSATASTESWCPAQHKPDTPLQGKQQELV